MNVSPAIHLRAAGADDEAFILGLVGRFTEFPLPAGRDRTVITQGIRADLAMHLRERPQDSHFFVVDSPGQSGNERAGFIHLQLVDDFFGEGRLCHISDLAIAPGFEGRGLAGALLAHGERFGREQGCVRLTLGVFPGNERARALYERHGFGLDMLRMGKPLIS